MPGPRFLRSAPAVVLLLAVAGCSGGEEPEPEPAPRPQPSTPGTPLASYDTRSAAVTREPFCDLLGESAVEDALGGAATASDQYANGDRARLAPGLQDVVHEFGCRHERGQSEARAWLFVPPVTPGRARDLVSGARNAQGCTADLEAPDFGAPSVALLCTQGRTATASYRGLFGDAWLSCSITVPMSGLDRPELFDRTGRWCVEVVDAASG